MFILYSGFLLPLFNTFIVLVLLRLNMCLPAACLHFTFIRLTIYLDILSVCIYLL